MKEKFERINERENQIKPKISNTFKIIVIFISIIIICLLIAVIVLLSNKSKKSSEQIEKDTKKEDEKEEEKKGPSLEDLIIEMSKKAGYYEPWNELYGYNFSNIAYVENDIIINSFKKESYNYKEYMGEINNGKDYQKNDRNFYNLFIPYSTDFRKEKHNGIILFIHGGSWTSGNKEDMEYLCSRYAKNGYITATLGYTLLIENYTNYNIFRIMDEITACIKSIKEKLKTLGFDENKLELALGGTSAGGHLALLYAYSIKNSPIPIKFIIDIVGPISLEPQYLYKIANIIQPLDSIYPKDIEDAFKNNKMVKIFEDESAWVGMMNLFLGKIYKDEELKEMTENNLIKTDNPKYQYMLKIVENAFPVKFIDNNTVPTLCEYGGRDSLVGIVHYKYLEELFEKNGIKDKIELIYMKYGGHELVSYDTEDGLKAMRELNYKILRFAEKYFTSDV